MLTLRRVLTRFGRWPVVAAWMLIIVALSSIPNNFPSTDPSELNADKAVHFGLYAVLAGLAFSSVVAAAGTAPRFLAAAGVLAACAVFGALDELYQHLIPGRDPNPLDWVADVLGAACGVILAAIALRAAGGPGVTRQARDLG